MLPPNLVSAVQIMNLCCSLYLIDSEVQYQNDSVSNLVSDPTPDCKDVFGHRRGGFPPLLQEMDLQQQQVRNCIPRVSTCCLLQIIDVEFDIMNRPHYIYGPNPNHSSLALKLGLLKSQQQISHGQEEEEEEEDDDEDEVIIPELPPFEEIPYGGPRWLLIESWEIAVKTCATVPIALIAIAGNAAVIRIIFKCRLTKNSVNLFILNMSIADLLNALIFPWVFLVMDFYQRYVLGKIICEYHSTVLNTFMLTSIFSLCAISFDRLTAVVFPFRAKMTPTVAKYVIYTIWIIAASISAPLVIWRTYQERQWKDFFESYCTEDRTKARLFWLVLISALFWFPIGVLVISYTAIIIKLHFLEKRQTDHGHGHTSQIRAKSKVIWMFFLVLVAFIICWTPFTIVTYVRSKRTADGRYDEVPLWLDHLLFAGQYLMIVNSAINPIIYGFKNENLRRGFRSVLPSCCKRQNKIEVSTIMAEQKNRQQKRQPKPQPQREQFHVPSSGLESREDILNNAVKMNMNGGGGGTRIKNQNHHAIADMPTAAPVNQRGSAGSNILSFQFFAKTRKYYENILFANNNNNNNSGMEKASLNSYERRDSALADLGLPVPPAASAQMDGATEATGTTTLGPVSTMSMSSTVSASLTAIDQI